LALATAIAEHSLLIDDGNVTIVLTDALVPDANLSIISVLRNGYSRKNLADAGFIVKFLLAFTKKNDT
jgi:hypothetical protein